MIQDIIVLGACCHRGHSVLFTNLWLRTLTYAVVGRQGGSLQRDACRTPS